MVSQTKCSSRTIILQLAVDENYAESFTFLVQAKYYLTIFQIFQLSP